jgi:membrane peptidoglycan carboxypeptidase
VHNYEDAYLGPIDVTSATIHSDNAVYAQLTRLVGPLGVLRTAHRLGIQSRLYAYYAIGLGAEAVNPLEMARAFSAFANGGFRIDGASFGNTPRAIEWVKDRHDAVIADNRPVPHRVLKPETVGLLDSILQDVVREGTGTHAQLPDRPAAGKTGTTEYYGDAWFVGFTPQLAAAVWVGYPNRLIPMETEYHGEPVAGGTFPAEIWKAFMTRALKGKPVAEFPPAPSPYAAPRRVTWRDGKLELDNGYCRDTALVVYFGADSPSKVADCKPNEVDVPTVVGEPLGAAKARLEGQPLTPVIAYKPASPAQRLGRVLAQYPPNGRLSSYDKVTLVVAKPLHGLVPRLVGLSLARAEALLRARGLKAEVVGGDAGRVVRQAPAAGVAAAPGMRVTIRVAAG